MGAKTELALINASGRKPPGRGEGPVPPKSGPRRRVETCGTITPSPAEAQAAELLPASVLKLVSGWSSWTLEATTTLGQYTFKRGQDWKDAEGKVRTVVTIRLDFIYHFTSDNRAWQQNHKGFISDVLYATLAEVGQKGRPLQELARIEVAFLTGVVSTITLAGFLANTGLWIGEFITEHKKDISHWVVAFKNIMQARAALKKHAPTLYRALLRTALREVLVRIPDSVTAEDMANYVGKLGGIAFGNRFRTILQTLWDITRFFISTAMSAVTPAIRAGKAAAQEVEAAARRVQKVFKGQGVEMALAEAKAIVQEYAESEALIKAALQDLHQGLEKLES